MSKPELPRLPHVVRRMDTNRRGIHADVFPFPLVSLVPGAQYGVQKTAQCYFDPARLVLAIDGNAKRVMLVRAAFGCEMIFSGEIAGSLFLDKIPTTAEVASSDEWDDGGRVDYPRLGPGIEAALYFENRSDGPVTIAAAFIGLRSYAPFPWDEGDAKPWDKTRM